MTWWDGARAQAEAFGNVVMAAALTGGAVGATAAMLKGQPNALAVSTAAVSANFAMFACAFLGINSSLVFARGGEDDAGNWALAGATTGGFFTYGVVPQKVIRGSVAFGAAAAAAKLGIDSFGGLVEAAKEQRLRDGQADAQPRRPQT